MIVTNKLKQRFVKDVNAKIDVFQDDIFMSRIDLFGLTDKWNLFVTNLNNYSDEQEFLTHYSDVQKQAIAYVKNCEKYEDFCNINVNNFSPAKIKTFYKDDNVGKEFVSIDMRTSNFSVMKYFGVLTDNTYEEFLHRFTNDEHMINSKHLRQVIFGNCNPKKQIVMANFLMSLLVKDYLQDLEIVYFDGDEIIVRNDTDVMNLLLKMVNEASWYSLKLDKFVLGKIYGTKGYYKIRNNNQVSFHCLEPYELPFVNRAWNKEAYIDLDKKIIYKGKLATLDDFIFVAFEEKLRGESK